MVWKERGRGWVNNWSEALHASIPPQLPCSVVQMDGDYELQSPRDAAAVVKLKDPSVKSLLISFRHDKGLFLLRDVLPHNRHISEVLVVGCDPGFDFLHVDEPDEFCNPNFLLCYLSTHKELRTVTLSDFELSPKFTKALIRSVSRNPSIQTLSLCLYHMGTDDVAFLYQNSKASTLDLEFPRNTSGQRNYADVSAAMKQNTTLRSIRFGVIYDSQLIASSIDGLNTTNIDQITLGMLNEIVAHAVHRYSKRRETKLRKLILDRIASTLNQSHLDTLFRSLEVEALALLQCKGAPSSAAVIGAFLGRATCLESLELTLDSIGDEWVKEIAANLRHVKHLSAHGNSWRNWTALLNGALRVVKLHAHGLNEQSAKVVFNMIAKSKSMKELIVELEGPGCTDHSREHIMRSLRQNRSLNILSWNSLAQLQFRDKDMSEMNRFLARNDCFEDTLRAALDPSQSRVPIALVPSLMSVSSDWGVDDIAKSLISLSDKIGPINVCKKKRKREDSNKWTLSKSSMLVD